MATTDTIKNQIQNNNQSNTQASVENNFQMQLKSQFNDQFKAIQSIVPKHLTPERLIRIGMNAVGRNPKLMECTPNTIVGAVVNCGTLGLEPNLMGHAYIVPFFNNKTKQFEAQMQIGYKGLIELVRRTGQISNVYAHEVYEGDEFEYSYGLEKNLIHKPCGEENESKIIHFYAVYKLKDGAYDFIVMSRSQVEAHRDRFTKSKKKDTKEVYGPWADHFTEMAKKTVLIKLLKTAPISIEQQESKVIMEGLQKDESVSVVKEDPNNIGDGWVDASFTVIDSSTSDE